MPESLRESLTSALLLAGMVAVQMYLLRWFAFLLLPLLYVYARVFLTHRRRVETVGGPAPSALPAGALWLPSAISICQQALAGLSWLP